MDSPHEITRQIEVWLATVRAEDVDKLLTFYAPDAILLPTFSSALRHTPEERREYFERFLGSRPRGRVVEQNPRRYGSVAINSGLYTFTVTDPQGDREIAARFTFVYHRVGDRWLIVEHHSSVLPDMP